MLRFLEGSNQYSESKDRREYFCTHETLQYGFGTITAAPFAMYTFRFLSPSGRRSNPFINFS